MDDLRYPIGRFEMPSSVTPAERERHIADVETLPRALAEAASGLSAQQLGSPYRPEGWTLRQVVHHVADSHLNAYARFRLALTEAQPTIKPYDQAAWAELPDARQGPVEVSLELISALHARWVALMRAIGPGDWTRSFLHPERGALRVDQTLAMYAWHGRHHRAHIERARERSGWRR